MEPVQAKPPRKRRRWLILAAVLVLVSLCTWWNWPRGDARFVGKWNSQAEDGSRCVLTLFANGTAITQGPQYRVRHWWRVENGKLVSGFQTEGRLQTIALWLSNRIGAWTGTYYGLLYSEQSVAELTQDRIVLKLEDLMDHTSTTILTRIPE
jgi:hypothetical protein